MNEEQFYEKTVISVKDGEPIFLHTQEFPKGTMRVERNGASLWVVIWTPNSPASKVVEVIGAPTLEAGLSRLKEILGSASYLDIN